MVPAGEITDKTIAELAEAMEPGDTIIDGGNTHYHDDIRHAQELKGKGIHHIDCGTSGGVWGLERGYCLMIGGETEVVERLSPLFATIAPGVDSAERTPGRSGAPSPSEQGYLHCGPNGAGHFVKMVHNGIEYGLMAAYAEGLSIIHTPTRACASRSRTPRRARWRTRVLQVRDRHDRGRRGLAARQRGRLVAAGPDRAGAVSHQAGGVRRPRVGFGRGSLDVDRGDRGGRARAGAHGGAVLALRLARAGRVRGQSRSRRCARASAGTTRSLERADVATRRMRSEVEQGRMRPCCEERACATPPGAHAPHGLTCRMRHVRSRQAAAPPGGHAPPTRLRRSLATPLGGACAPGTTDCLRSSLLGLAQDHEAVDADQADGEHAERPPRVRPRRRPAAHPTRPGWPR